MEGHCLTGQSPQWAVVPMEEEEEEDEKCWTGEGGVIMCICQASCYMTGG